MQVAVIARFTGSLHSPFVRLLALALSSQLVWLVAPSAMATSAPEAKTEPGLRQVSVSGSGDLLVHTPLWEKARTKKGFDFTSQLVPLRSTLRADVNLCHLETPLTKSKPRGYPVFATPVELAKGIANAGWHGCSLASNHTFDAGQEGVALTRAALLREQVLPSGTRISSSDEPFAVHTTISGVKVAHLSYTYSTNGIPAPGGKDWMVNPIDVPRILSDARRAKERADVVVVAMHWGSEYQEAPNAMQIRIAQRLLKSNHIDAIIGHHVHVLQPADIIYGKPVIFGHGNLWSGQGPWSNHLGGQRGVVSHLTFDIDSDGKVIFTGGEYTPTLVDPTDWSVRAAHEIKTPQWRSAACTAVKETHRLYGKVLSPDSKTKSHPCHPN